jgi:hypothetical protein
LPLSVPLGIAESKLWDYTFKAALRLANRKYRQEIAGLRGGKSIEISPGSQFQVEFGVVLWLNLLILYPLGSPSSVVLVPEGMLPRCFHLPQGRSSSKVPIRHLGILEIISSPPLSHQLWGYRWLSLVPISISSSSSSSFNLLAFLLFWQLTCVGSNYFWTMAWFLISSNDNQNDVLICNTNL